MYFGFTQPSKREKVVVYIRELNIRLNYDRNFLGKLLEVIITRTSSKVPD